MKKIKLINPRGRIVAVSPQDVQRLLSRGFLKAPQQTHEYNPVFDRGSGGISISKTLGDIGKTQGNNEYLEATKI